MAVPGELEPGELVPGELVPGELVPGELEPTTDQPTLAETAAADIPATRAADDRGVQATGRLHPAVVSGPGRRDVSCRRLGKCRLVGRRLELPGNQLPGDSHLRPRAGRRVRGLGVVL